MVGPYEVETDSSMTLDEAADRIQALVRILDKERSIVRRLQHEVADYRLDISQLSADASDWRTVAEDHRAAALRLRNERDEARSEKKREVKK